jgi:hypothetical protein
MSHAAAPETGADIAGMFLPTGVPPLARLLPEGVGETVSALRAGAGRGLSATGRGLQTASESIPGRLVGWTAALNAARGGHFGEAAMAAAGPEVLGQTGRLLQRTGQAIMPAAEEAAPAAARMTVAELRAKGLLPPDPKVGTSAAPYTGPGEGLAAARNLKGQSQVIDPQRMLGPAPTELPAAPDPSGVTAVPAARGVPTRDPSTGMLRRTFTSGAGAPVADFPVASQAAFRSPELASLFERLADPRIANNPMAKAAIETAIKARMSGGNDPLYEALMEQLGEGTAARGAPTLPSAANAGRWKNLP